jgi:hypothetical protein
VDVVPAPDSEGRWRVTWQVHNDGPAALALSAAWIPHGRFRGDGRLALAEALAPGAAVRLTFEVRAREAPGTLVENAFLILRAEDARSGAWRIFGRMRVPFDTDGRPWPVVEVVSTQSLK